MKAIRFLFLVPMLALTFGWASAQVPASTPAPTPDPAKVADFEKRFAQGMELEKQDKLPEARAIYEGILADDPTAKRSLLHAGMISFQLGEMAKANDYLSRLRAIVPDDQLTRLHVQKPDEFPDVLDLLIQINQVLKRDVKVDILLKEYRALHDSNKVPEFSRSLSFVREQFHQGQDEVVVSQFFDFTSAPYTVWMAEAIDDNGHIQRRLLLNYDPEATKALRAKDPKYANTEVFSWMEHVIKNDKVSAINVYLQIFALPDYAKFRSAMLLILTNPPKPIYSAPVDAAATPAPAPAQ